MKSALIATLSALLFATSMFALGPNVADYHVVLVPVFHFGAGAFGSQWTTQVSIASTSDHVDMAMALFDDSPNCTSLDSTISSTEVRSICKGFASSSGSGVLLYVPKSLELAELSFNARARDLSRQASSAGTEISVVTESHFRNREFLLLDIPSDTRFRANLRVYGATESFAPGSLYIHPGGESSGSLEIYDSRDLVAPLVSTRINLSAPEAIAGSPFLLHPAFVSIGDLVATFPQLANVPKYTIRITPYQTIADPPREWSMWAFVSITNNETQEVTTVSP